LEKHWQQKPAKPPNITPEMVMMQGLLREMFGLVRMVLKDKDADLLLATERARAAVTVNVECDGTYSP
jgi:hypothetical protein